MNNEQEERLVAAWEGVARGLGALNETARIAISKQWPKARKQREAVVSKLPTAEEKRQQETGNSTGSIDEWINEFDPEEEIGPREREFIARQGKPAPNSKASSKAGGSGTAGA